jgi:hypothetical protein
MTLTEMRELLVAFCGWYFDYGAGRDESRPTDADADAYLAERQSTAIAFGDDLAGREDSAPAKSRPAKSTKVRLPPPSPTPLPDEVYAAMSETWKIRIERLTAARSSRRARGWRDSMLTPGEVEATRIACCSDPACPQCSCTRELIAAYLRVVALADNLDATEPGPNGGHYVDRAIAAQLRRALEG